MDMDATTTIARPPAEVFEYVADVTNDVNWRSALTRSGWRSDPPYGVGSVGYAATDQLETVYRVTTFEPNARVDWDFIEGPLVGSGGYRLEQVERGTRFTLVAAVKPTGAMRLLGPIFSWVGRRQNRTDVETLRGILE